LEQALTFYTSFAVFNTFPNSSYAILIAPGSGSVQISLPEYITSSALFLNCSKFSFTVAVLILLCYGDVWWHSSLHEGKT